MSDISANTLKIVVEGTSQVYSKELINLTTGTQYYYRAYAKSDKFTAYGEVLTFTPTEPEEFFTIGNLMIQNEDIGTALTFSAGETMCKSSQKGGYSDWRLPNLTECAIMYNDRGCLGLAEDNYWTSYTSYYSYTTHYYYYDMINGTYNSEYSGSLLRVRCVRTITN